MIRVDVGGGVMLIAGQFTAVALIWRVIARRGHPAVAIVAYPALIVSAEYLVSLVSPHGTFGSLAYSQADVPVVIQLASVTGLTGISSVVSLVAAALAVSWRHRHAPRVAFAGLAIAAVPAAATLAFGAARLAEPAPLHRVPRSGSQRWRGSAPLRHAGSCRGTGGAPRVRAARRFLADQEAKVVVLPEKFVGITAAYADEARAALAAVARERRVLIVAGFNVSSPNRGRSTSPWSSGRTGTFRSSTTRFISFPASKTNIGRSDDRGVEGG